MSLLDDFKYSKDLGFNPWGRNGLLGNFKPDNDKSKNSILNNFVPRKLSFRDWGKNTLGRWCVLPNTNFSVLSFSGVYIIWGYLNSQIVVIKVGQSTNLANRISDYKVDNQLLSYCEYPLVTWTKLPVVRLNGVERYIGEYYNPLISKRFPDAAPIEVNLPF